MRSFFPASSALLIGVVTAASGAAQAAVGLASIRLSADPEILLADGKSTTTLTAEVRDEQGRVVPDGTLVRFSTTGGRLDTTTAQTRNGVARVTLTAANLPGTALVTANLEALGAAPAQRIVSFTSEAEAALTGSNWARIDGAEYVGYAVDNGVIQANGRDGRAQIAYRGIEIHADALQVEVASNAVRALGNVRLVRGGETRTFSSLQYNLSTGEGSGERIEEGKPVPLLVSGLRLDETPAADSLDPQGLALLDISGASLTVKARSIALEPNVRLQFRRAEFYMDGSKVLTLPFHLMNLGQETLFTDQIVGFGPNGVSVDFPLHYDVRPSAVGTLYLRRSARVGSSVYATRPGWSLDLEQNYNRGGASDGTIEVTGVTRRDWGARWTHAQRLGAETRGQFYLDFPNHSDLFGNMTLARSFRGFTLNATGSASRSAIYSGGIDPLNSRGGDWRGQIYGETNPRSLAGARNGGLQYTLNLSTARQGFYGPDALPGYTAHTAGVRLFASPLSLGRGARLSQSLSVGQTWTAGGGGRVRDGVSVFGTVALAQQIGRLGNARLTYDHTQTPEQAFSRSAGRHRVGGNLFLNNGAHWNLDVTASRALDQPFSTLYGSLRFNLSGPWGGRVTISSSQLAAYGYQDIEYALIRRIGGRDIALYYSTTARRFQLDLTGARF